MGIISDCSVENPGDEVVVGGNIPGSTGQPPTGSTPGADDGSGGGVPVDRKPSRTACNGGLPTSHPLYQQICVDDEDPAPEIRQVTVSDVLRFAPAAPSIATEPEGVAIVGMPMNIVVPVDAHTDSGTLFDLPVTVRFDPQSLTIDYGDGTETTVPAESASWDDLGQAEFTATPTSHSYAERGHFTVTVRVLYTATVDFGEHGSQRVNGAVASAEATARVQAVTADTGLVEHTCAEDPSGPGC